VNLRRLWNCSSCSSRVYVRDGPRRHIVQ